MDIMAILNHPIPNDSVVYVDPPYQDTTGYAFGFDVTAFIRKFREVSEAPLFVSEGAPLNSDAILLDFGGAKGGISGVRKGKHQEWINRFSMIPSCLALVVAPFRAKICDTASKFGRYASGETAMKK